jgi:hypothetical protein
MGFNISLIHGFSVGLEYYEDFEEDLLFVSIDLGLLRILLIKPLS